MAQTIDKLKALTVSRLKKPGMYPDGRGLYLQISSAGAKSWVYRYTLRGRSRDMGLGSAFEVTLEAAREAAGAARALRAQGIDPIDDRNHRRAADALEAAKATTFKRAAEDYIAAHRAAWTNPGHAQQWGATLETYAYPVLGDLPVQEIDTALVLKVLTPIWQTRTVTATRLRGRIESILDAAKARGQRTGENPARWRGHLDVLLASPKKLRKVAHLPALPYADIHHFMTDLRQQPGAVARALEFTILCASRTGEVLGAKRSEFDMGTKVWTIPAERMKAGKEHKVPLSDAAVAVVEAAWGDRQGDGYVFPGFFPGRRIGDDAMRELLRRMRGPGLTVHGFRSAFRDWASEKTSHQNHVVEMAMAHGIDNEVEAAYRRGELMEKRRKLMADWAAYCDTAPDKTGKVIPLRAS